MLWRLRNALYLHNHSRKCQVDARCLCLMESPLLHVLFSPETRVVRSYKYHGRRINAMPSQSKGTNLGSRIFFLLTPPSLTLPFPHPVSLTLYFQVTHMTSTTFSRNKTTLQRKWRPRSKKFLTKNPTKIRLILKVRVLKFMFLVSLFSKKVFSHYLAAPFFHNFEYCSMFVYRSMFFRVRPSIC